MTWLHKSLNPNFSRLTGIFASLILAGILLAALVEIGLRLLPSIIPESVLMDFNEVPRSDIAEKRNLPSISNTVLIRRDDGGPELRIPKPFNTRDWPDREFGSVSDTQVDHMGFCNPLSSNYDDGFIALLTLGDSFIWCTGIDSKDTWPNLLSSYLGISSYNLAAIGIGLHEHVQLLKRFGISKSPHIVIMNFYEGNDLKDAEYFQNYTEGISDPIQLSAVNDQSCGIFQRLIKGGLGDRSYSYNMLMVLLKNACVTSFASLKVPTGFSERWASGEGDFRYRFALTNFSVDFNLKNVDHNEVVYADRLRSGELDIDVLIPPLIDLVELSNENGFIPILTYTPSAYTAYTDYVIFEDEELHELMEWFSSELRDFLAKESDLIGLRFLDLTPNLQDAATRTESREDLLYFPVNRHLTIRGHQVVAEAVGSMIKESGAIDSIDRPFP